MVLSVKSAFIVDIGVFIEPSYKVSLDFNGVILGYEDCA